MSENQMDGRVSKSEDLTNWYFRLNGFLTIPNFILHPSRRGSQRTDADVVGIRFPFRNEFKDEEVDDSKLQCSPTKPSFIIAEVKSSEVKLNDTWASSSKENINKTITDIGLLQDDMQIKQVSKALYETGKCDVEEILYYFSFAFVGNIDTGIVDPRYSSVPRILWTDLCKFIHQRFRRFAYYKSDHQQWDQFGKDLYELAEQNREPANFEKAVRIKCGLPSADQGRTTY